MEDRKFIFMFFIFVFFLFSGLGLYAQAPSSELQPGFFIDKSAGEAKFKQRLVWEEDEYASKYEVEIEILSGHYIYYHSETTEKTYIEIPLPPGRYQYRVTTFDLLGHRSDTSGWEKFEVITAFQPEITKVTPDFFYMDQFHERELTISGKNIFDKSIISIRNGMNELVPIKKVVVNDSSVKLTFNDYTLIPGVYEIYIENPGGLDVSYGGFFVGYHRRFEAFLKLGYNPPIPVSGELKNTFGMQLYYPGVTLRLELLASERASYKFGLEYVGSYYYLSNTFSSKDIFNNSVEYDVSTSLIDFSVNISMQSRFNHLRNAISFAFGFGLTTDSNTVVDDFETTSNKTRNGHMNLSLIGLFLIYRNFYVETGVDFTYYLSNSSILIKPRAGLVLRI
jgi:hypothetical protein